MAQRVKNREIRDWGRDNGWADLDGRGRIPEELRQAYEVAHPDGITDVGIDIIEPPAGSYPSFGDDDGEDLDISDLIAPPPPGDYTPPPANLDEARDRAAKLPGSAHLRRNRRGSQAKPAGQTEPDIKVTPKVIGDIEGKLAFWLGLTAEPWAVADPYCGKAYADQVPEIAKKLAPIVCQSPDLVRWFSKSSTFIMWTELGIAVRPVATAVIKHHVTKTVKLDEKGATVAVPAGGVDFSAYASKPAA